MSKIMRIKIAVLSLVFAIILIAPKNVSAYNPTDLTKKALMQALNACYSGGGLTNEFAKVGDYGGRDSLYSSSVRSDLALPTGNIFHDINDSNLSCENVLKGHSSLTGGKISDVFTYMGHPAPAKGADNVGSWLETYAGYSKTETLTDSGKCIKFKFTYSYRKAAANATTQTEEKFTDQICVDDVESGVIKSAPYIKKDGEWNKTHGVTAPYTSTVIDTFRIDSQTSDLIITEGVTGSGYNATLKTKNITTVSKKWSDFVSEIVTEIPNTQMVFTYQCMDRSCTNGNASAESVYSGQVPVSKDDGSGASGSYKLNNNSAKTAIKNLYGASFTGSYPTVDKQEKVHLYMYYLETLFAAKIDCSVTADVASGNGYDGPIKWFKSGEKNITEGCYVKSHNNRGNVNGVTNGVFKNEDTTYEDLIKFFSTDNLDGVTTLDDASESSTGTTEEDPGTNEEDADPTCYDGAGSLGWILCPIIEQASDAIQGIYDKFIVPFLKLDPELFKSGNATFEAWTQFRDIANVLFIILFIAVIISQVTGIGIDNYGIKKILPKLILGAVLINLSFIICQLCIDIANIVGYGIGGLFENLAKYEDVASISIEGTMPSGSAVGIAAGAVIIVALIIALSRAGLLAIGAQILVPVFMVVVTVFIAILFCFALLAVRKAFAVILVVISPVAFACYMLPNTKKFFDKWMGAFRGVLIAFPVCSAMIYGGQMVARILVSASGGDNLPFAIGMSAAVISIVPIFMIPKAIQGSVAMVAGGLVGLQNRLTGRAKGGIMRSGFAQDAERRRQMQKSGIRFNKDGKAEYTLRGRVQNRLPRTRGSKQRLDMARRQAALGEAQMGGAGQFTGDAGLKKMTNMQMAANAGRASQDVQDEIAAMSNDYATENQMIDDFYSLSSKDSFSEEEQLRYKALMTKLSGSSQGKKALANVARGAVASSSNGRKEMASYATNGDGGVLNGMGDKDAYAAAYMEYVASGGTNDFAAWGAQTDSKGRTNIQAITEDRLDDNTKLMSQSGDARNDAFSATNASGGYVVSDSRINAIENDKDMQAQYADKIQDIYGKSGRNPVVSQERHDLGDSGTFTIQHRRDGSEQVTGADGAVVHGNPNSYRAVSTDSYSLHGAAPIEVTKMADGRFIRKDNGQDITSQIGRYKKV